MDWDDARYFLAAFRGGSLSAAAKTLGCSHSTVRRRLQGLEDSLGTPLFVASPDGLVPTDEAREAIPHAESIEGAAMSFARHLSGRSEALTGRVVVTTIDAMVDWLTPGILAFHRAHPHIELELLTGISPLDLARREADVAVRMTNKPNPALFGRKVSQLQFAPFATKKLARKYKGREHEIPWILFSESAGAVLTEKWYRRFSGGRAPVVRVSQGNALMSLMQSGLGGGLIPTSLATRSMVQLGDAMPELASDVWCLTHYDLRHSTRIREFMRCVAEIDAG